MKNTRLRDPLKELSPQRSSLNGSRSEYSASALAGAHAHRHLFILQFAVTAFHLVSQEERLGGVCGSGGGAGGAVVLVVVGLNSLLAWRRGKGGKVLAPLKMEPSDRLV